MSGDIPERATCEVCGTSFDPRESRGWCPNSACGKWQHPAFPLAEERTGAADGGVDTPTKVCPSCGKDVRADANFCKFCSHEFSDEPEPTGGPSSPGLDECPDCGADLSSIPADRLADCPICGTDLSGVLADQSEPDVTPADLTNCPACRADLTDIPADMRMVCPDCRVDLEAAIADHGVPEPGEEPAPESAGDPADSVDTIKGIGASYADRLADAGIYTVADLVTADVSALAEATDISEKRLGEWIERAPIDPADLGVAPPDAGGEPDQPADAPPADRPPAGQGADPPPESQAGGNQAPGRQQGGQPAGGQSPGPQQGGQPPPGSQGQPPQQGGTAGGRAGGGGPPPGSEPQGGDTMETRVQPHYDTVVIEVMGQEIRAQPGDTVGREIRTAMVEGGAPDNDAVYVHREHLRVERENDTFYFVRLGQNSMKVNDEPVEQGERAPVADGDTVSFSEVVTATVRLE